MSVGQSHFRYMVFTNSSLEVFDKVQVLETLLSSYTQKVFPKTSVDENFVGFEFEADRNLYLDMRDIHLSLRVQLFKGRLFDALIFFSQKIYFFEVALGFSIVLSRCFP